MVIISLFCSLNKIHKRLYFYYYLNKWLNLVCAVSKSSHAFFYTAGFCCASFKTFCMFLLIRVYSMFLNNVPLSGELWEINYVDTVCLYLRCFLWLPSVRIGFFKINVNTRNCFFYLYEGLLSVLDKECTWEDLWMVVVRVLRSACWNPTSDELTLLKEKGSC